MEDFSFWLVIAGLLLVGLELLVGVATGFDLVLLGFALIAGGGTGYLLGDWKIAVLISGALSLLYVIVGRRTVKKWLLVATNSTNIDNLVGREGEVVKKGQVKVDGEVWRAKGVEKMKNGTRITVKSVEGVTLTVSRA